MSKKKKPEEPSAASLGASAMARARWAKVKPADRRRILRRIGRLGGRPKSTHRCFCGAVTMVRAASRNFDCCRAAGVEMPPHLAPSEPEEANTAA